jgi:photosystem II stability/assembly factor-like uncharacterized protein
MNIQLRIVIVAMVSLQLIAPLHAQWVQQNSGTTQRLTDVAVLDSTTALVVGTRNVILKTTNSGVTWDQVPLPISSVVDWNAISFWDALQGAIAGRNVVATTIDGGGQWNIHDLAGSGECHSVLQIGPGNIYAGDDSGRVYHSLDTGKNWTSEKIGDLPVYAFFVWRGPYVMGLPIYALTPQSLYTKTEFPPGTWEEIALPIRGLGSEALDGEFCKGGGPGFIVGVQGDFIASPTILRKATTDSVWRTLDTGILFGGTLIGVSAPSDRVVYVCGTGGMIWKSVNGGDAWTTCDVPKPRNIYALDFYDENRGFAVGDSGTILYTSNGAVTSVGRNDRIPGVFALEQNYPNPFNPKTVISYQLPVTSKASLKVYDLLGREVAILVDEFKQAGSYSVRWNAQGMPSGVYFYRLVANAIPSGQAGSAIEVRKLVLLK